VSLAKISYVLLRLLLCKRISLQLKQLFIHFIGKKYCRLTNRLSWPRMLPPTDEEKARAYSTDSADDNSVEETTPIGAAIFVRGNSKKGNENETKRMQSNRGCFSSSDNSPSSGAKRRRSVSFDGAVKVQLTTLPFSCFASFTYTAMLSVPLTAPQVVLIPTCAEYARAGLARSLWWSEHDCAAFKQQAVVELRAILARYKLDARAAIQMLYQPNPTQADADGPISVPQDTSAPIEGQSQQKQQKDEQADIQGTLSLKKEFVDAHDLKTQPSPRSVDSCVASLSLNDRSCSVDRGSGSGSGSESSFDPGPALRFVRVKSNDSRACRVAAALQA
jgi:hypothetical protein